MRQKQYPIPELFLRNFVNKVSIMKFTSSWIKFTPCVDLRCRCHLFIVPINYGKVMVLKFQLRCWRTSLQRETNKVIWLPSFLWRCSCEIYWMNHRQTFLLSFLNNFLRCFSKLFPSDIQTQVSIFKSRENLYFSKQYNAILF